jgi:hypothetical protein
MAYVFYATDDSYACSVLINIRRLKKTFKTKYKIRVLVSPMITQFYRTKMTELGAKVTEHEPPAEHPDSIQYYQYCLLKLLAFKMHQIDTTLKRVLVLDGDQLILQNLDPVFDLPSVDLAAPRAYWIGRTGTGASSNRQGKPSELARRSPSAEPLLTSTFMLIEPSDRLWGKVQAKLDHMTKNVFDMDIVNDLFEPSALLLPGSYATLNSQWEDLALPSWYRGVPSPEPGRRYTRLSADELAAKQQELKDAVAAQDDPWDQPELYLQYQLADAAGEALNKFPPGDAADEDLERLWGQAQVLHFTAVGKPWSYKTGDVKLMRPYAHEIFFRSWGVWRTEAKELCNGLVAVV